MASEEYLEAHVRDLDIIAGPLAEELDLWELSRRGSSGNHLVIVFSHLLSGFLSFYICEKRQGTMLGCSTVKANESNWSAIYTQSVSKEK